MTLKHDLGGETRPYHKIKYKTYDPVLVYQFQYQFLVIKNLSFPKFKMKFAKSHLCSPNFIWDREKLVDVRKLKICFAH